jgi:hypothetical protein
MMAKNDEVALRRKEAEKNAKLRRNLTKERREYLNESSRIRYRLNNPEVKRAVSLDKYRKAYGTRSKRERLLVAPLLPYLNAAVPNRGDGQLKYLSELSGIDHSALRRFQDGEYTTIRLLDADALCMALGLTLYEVYGFDIGVGRGKALDAVC